MRQQTRPLKDPAEKVVQDIQRATRKPADRRRSVIASRPPKDLPQGLEQNLGTRSPDDQTPDRKMQICRGC